MSKKPDLQKATKRRLLSTLAVLLLLAGPIAAQDLDAGAEALYHGDYATALEIFRPLAEQGDDIAQVLLGSMYAQGQGVVQDYTETEKWYRRSTAQGNARAQANLGAMYALGQWVVQDYSESRKWYRQAAEQGKPGAQLNLGIMYKRGMGEQDDVQAHKWFNLAAAQGLSDAAKNRDRVGDRMTPAQIAEAQKLAREWASKLGG